ncbi:hypothetical protein M231_00792 [Tremella mesenterica]|uniref:Uncharacterized protein n=1 Tax=Tremella mesenterica TaxID=5217 RepID=A0A4Q1BVF1_TREME|nr:hypothetical protein M231_00792 [Tremella mesenterica]
MSPKRRQDPFSFSEAGLTQKEDVSIEKERTERMRRKKKDEPMSPLTVVSYVIFFYIIWQILTRSDEHEILSHLPQTSLLTHHVDHHGVTQQPYQFPYPIPHLPPMPPQAPSDPSTPYWRTALSLLIYPLYLLIAILATPLPLFLNIIHLVYSLLSTLLYPFTSILRVLLRVFVLAPLRFAGGVMEAVYPLYVFVAGVLGIGCVMGIGAGLVGTRGVDWLMQLKNDKQQTRQGVVSKTLSRVRSSRPERSQSGHILSESRPSESNTIYKDDGPTDHRGSAVQTSSTTPWQQIYPYIPQQLEVIWTKLGLTEVTVPLLRKTGLAERLGISEVQSSSMYNGEAHVGMGERHDGVRGGYREYVEREEEYRGRVEKENRERSNGRERGNKSERSSRRKSEYSGAKGNGKGKEPERKSFSSKTSAREEAIGVRKRGQRTGNGMMI